MKNELEQMKHEQKTKEGRKKNQRITNNDLKFFDASSIDILEVSWNRGGRGFEAGKFWKNLQSKYFPNYGFQNRMEIYYK